MIVLNPITQLWTRRSVDLIQIHVIVVIEEAAQLFECNDDGRGSCKGDVCEPIVAARIDRESGNIVCDII